MNLDQPQILIADDEPEVRTMLHAALAPKGFRISEASDGAGMMAAIEADIPIVRNGRNSPARGILAASGLGTALM